MYNDGRTLRDQQASKDTPEVSRKSRLLVPGARPPRAGFHQSLPKLFCAKCRIGQHSGCISLNCVCVCNEE